MKRLERRFQRISRRSGPRFADKDMRRTRASRTTHDCKPSPPLPRAFGFARRGRRRGGAELSDPSDPLDHRLSAGRADRHPGAHHGRLARDAARPAGDRREQAGRGEQHRDRGGDQRGAGRLRRSARSPRRTRSTPPSTSARSSSTISSSSIPVSGMSQGPSVLVVNPSIPASNIAELIAYAKANPGKINFGSPGVGSTGHLAAELFKAMAGVDLVHVPYRGAAPAMTDLMAGHVQVVFDSMVSVLPHVQAGRRARARRHQQGALAAAARPADHRRDPAGLRGDHLVRRRRAARHAARDRRAAQPRDQRGARLGGDQGEVRSSSAPRRW